MPLQLIYTSAETHRMRPKDLADLLEHSREKNERLGVTGLLLYRSGAFIQVLEGEKKALKNLYEKIKSDERHQGVTTLRTRSIEAREFDGWSMGFRNLSDEDMDRLRDLDGYSNFLDPKNTVQQLQQLAQHPSHAREALLRFKGE